MGSTRTVNTLLAVVCVGFVWLVGAGEWTTWSEGPMGAWIIPVPFLLVLLGVMTACLVRGRFDRLPGGRAAAVMMLIGFMAGVGWVLAAAWERRDSPLDLLFRVLPFVILIGCFWAAVGSESRPARRLRVAGPAILALTSAAGWGMMGYGVVARVRDDREAAERQSVRDRANDAARAAKAGEEFRALPADAPLIRLIAFEFATSEALQKEARARIAAWPDLEGEIARILTSETLSVSDMSWTISYIADVYASPTASLAPAYAHALDKAYRYWESTMKYDQYAARSEPVVSVLIRGAERIQKAGGDLRPQLRAWHGLLKQARGLGGLAGYVQDVIQGR